MTDSVIRQSITIPRYRSKRQKSRAVSSDDSTNVSPSSPTIDTPSLMGLAISEPARAANGVEAIAARSSDDHTKTSMVPVQVDTLRDVTFRTLVLMHFTDFTIVSIRSDTVRDARSDAETQEYGIKATSGLVNEPTGVSALPSERTQSLYSFDKSLNHSQPIALRHQDGPPKSSEINATTVPKAHRVPTNDNERRAGCFSFFRHGSRRRTKPGHMTKATAGCTTEHSDVEHLYGTCNEGTQEPGKASLEKGTKSEASEQRGAGGYHRSSSLPELAKQESVKYSAVDTVSRDWRPLEYVDLASVPSSRSFDQLSPRSPYDMRYGAVQPQYFRTDETSMYRQIAPTDLQRQSSVQRRTSGGSIGSSPSYVRSGTTLSTSSSTRRKPLVDLTPQYQPPPQHRHKGHGYYPQQLGSGKLVDYATSPKKDSSIPFALG
jgi:hypothetical protein